MSNFRKKHRHPRDFTVQIRHAIDDDVIVGTGFVISTEGQIVTCDHVVRDASELGDVREGVTVRIYFPQTSSPEKLYTAKVAGYFENSNDDIVILQLEADYLPTGVEVAILGTAQDSVGHPFKSWGYRRLRDYLGLPATGTIIDFTERPQYRILKADPVMLDSKHIDSGMSGAPVLDTERDLVVGVIAETWDSQGSHKDRDTCFAVDNRVLTFEPMNLSITNESPSESLQNQDMVEEEATNAVNKTYWNNAPEYRPDEWVGRDDLIGVLNDNWCNVRHRVVGLIGFGGEGKTTLTRRWIEELLHDKNLPQPKAIFWWGFYEERDFDKFLNEALKVFIRDFDPDEMRSTSVTKVNLLQDLLHTGRYIFVLDGLEVLQHPKGDSYGLFSDRKLKEFLNYFAEKDHLSFCAINSRAPVVDLFAYNTYISHDVEHLSLAEGRTLLRKIGVKGKDDALNEVVKKWDGYVLILSLIGSYLVDAYDGNVKYVRNLPSPTEEDSHYERVQKVLEQYDRHLSAAEKEFLTIFSAFRLPVGERAFNMVFRGEKGLTLPERQQKSHGFFDWLLSGIQDLFEFFFPSPRRASTRLRQKLNVPLIGLEKKTFNSMINLLVKYRILRDNPDIKYYTIQPIIRTHYEKRLSRWDIQKVREIHEQIAEYYQAIAGPIPENPRKEDFLPWIETVYHLCRAEKYDRAAQIVWTRIMQKEKFLFLVKLCEHKILLELLSEFFPEKNIFKDPQINSATSQSFILGQVVKCLEKFGKFRDAIKCVQKALEISINSEHWENATRAVTRLSSLYAKLGQLELAKNLADKSLTFAFRASDETDKCGSKYFRGCVAYLQGDFQIAQIYFQEAETLAKELNIRIDIAKHFLEANYIIYLHRMRHLEQTRNLTKQELNIRKKQNQLVSISSYYKVLGDLEADDDNLEIANQHYQKALSMARNYPDRSALINALLGQGTFLAKQRRDLDTAYNNLNEALSYATESEYRLAESHIRIGLAWAHLATEKFKLAQTEAERAKKMSQEMGYHWGQVDADEVLEALKNEEVSIG